jgi:hypothetical protein
VTRSADGRPFSFLRAPSITAVSSRNPSDPAELIDRGLAASQPRNTATIVSMRWMSEMGPERRSADVRDWSVLARQATLVGTACRSLRCQKPTNQLARRNVRSGPPHCGH